MRTFLLLLLHLVTTVAKLIGPGGAKALVAESLLLKHQLLIVNRTRQRAVHSKNWIVQSVINSLWFFCKSGLSEMMVESIRRGDTKPVHDHK